MPFIPVDVGSVQEAKPVTQGMYDLVITTCEETVTRESKKPQFRISLGIEGHTEAPNVSHFMSIPAEGDDAGKTSFKVLLIKRFCTLFGVPMRADGIDTAALAMEMVGKRARAEVTLSEPDDNGNVYNRLNIPKMRDESTAGVPKPPKR